MRSWNAEETKALIGLYSQNKSNIDIASALGRTTASVSQKLCKLGLGRPRGTNGSYFGMKNPMEGRKHSPETLAKMRVKAVERLKDRTKHPAWKGGKRINQSGYVCIRNPDHPRAVNGYVFEHILVIEWILKRYLSEKECVHHVDGNRKNNSPENLILFRDNADHQRYHEYLRKREVFQA